MIGDNKTTIESQAADTEALVELIPENTNKAREYGHRNALSPPRGLTAAPRSSSATASTLSEDNLNLKTGGAAEAGVNATIRNLEHVREDSSGQRLTTNQGVPISDNQHSLKAGLRGPTLLEDFILREKITHFDHERIPERIVHARGSAAHGYFEAYEDFSQFTRAAPFADAGKITPVFVRFSTVVGERGSVDTARDVRGFAVKFYTDEGNWDLVGNNIPVFFIQDAMKFPDLVHAIKPEPHHGMPQAASAHDTFWDFASLMPEITHMLMWVMSDRALPRSYRMMQGFGVHTFRLINAYGESNFVKFHWKPKLGTHSLVWDEASKIQGADADFHRRDLWDAIEAGDYPEWELGLQIFSEEAAESFSFDVLDATKIIPEELVPIRPAGRMVLNRNPDNFFAETEQVAFCAAHIIPGIDFSNDPLLAGRIHSYTDTQITRLGGPNFHEIPINSPIAPVHNNQRDGLHRQTSHRGRVAYEPNSLGGGCPFQAGESGFMSYPQAQHEDKLRGKPDKFADHYTQAILFWNSQTEWEKVNIIGGFRFELSKVKVAAIRSRMLASLANVSPVLASMVADGIGMEVPSAAPVVMEPVTPEISRSPALSLTALPGDGSINTRRIAILVADGIEGGPILDMREALRAQGAMVSVVGFRIGVVYTDDGTRVEADASFENSPSVLFDALVLPGGDAGVESLLSLPQVIEYIKQQYQHGKTIAVFGSSKKLLDKAEINQQLPSGQTDTGVLFLAADQADSAAEQFIAAVGMHRHYSRMDCVLV
jgi:catalase